MTSNLSVVPASAASGADLQAIFGERGPAMRCQCQRYKLRPRESFRSFPVAERARRLREQTRCGDPGAPATSGLVAYLDGEPVGWCAVEPRTAYGAIPRPAIARPAPSGLPSVPDQPPPCAASEPLRSSPPGSAS